MLLFATIQGYCKHESRKPKIVVVELSVNILPCRNQPFLDQDAGSGSRRGFWIKTRVLDRDAGSGSRLGGCKVVAESSANTAGFIGSAGAGQDLQ